MIIGYQNINLFKHPTRETKTNKTHPKAKTNKQTSIQTNKKQKKKKKTKTIIQTDKPHHQTTISMTATTKSKRPTHLHFLYKTLLIGKKVAYCIDVKTDFKKAN